ncbi:MAG TPA: hypothetical protein VHZ52_05760 [Acidobacteriaceae bacterium]|jgi:hypothetical protein|nr:hypothetical protein [Acidobacteriaceae bacterium]
MSATTIRNLDPLVKARIKTLAKTNGRTMAGEIRALLRIAVGLGPADEEVLKQGNTFSHLQRDSAEALIGDLMLRARRVEAKRAGRDGL